MSVYDLTAAQPPRDERGNDAASDLFDTVAVLHFVESDINRMRIDGEIEEDKAGLLSRAIRVSMARLEALAVRLDEGRVRCAGVGGQP